MHVSNIRVSVVIQYILVCRSFNEICLREKKLPKIFSNFSTLFKFLKRHGDNRIT